MGFLKMLFRDEGLGLSPVTGGFNTEQRSLEGPLSCMPAFSYFCNNY